MEGKKTKWSKEQKDDENIKSDPHRNND